MKLLYTQDSPTPEDYFAVGANYPPQVIAEGKRIIAFLHYLQQHNPRPDLYLHTEMFGLNCSLLDYSGAVRVEPRNQQLHLSYAIPKRWSGWDNARVVGHTADISEATAMLLAAFEQQPRPSDWRDELLATPTKQTSQNLETLRIRLQRISEQAPETLYAYYEALQTDTTLATRYAAEHMLAFLAQISDETGIATYWCYTQGTSLTLTNHDAIHTGVTIRPTANISYSISYTLDPDRAPWTDAQIEGSTQSLDETIHVTAVALRQKWPR
ncbi:MAG: hypothetical protein AAGF95_09610 [Chloroflexota bacterium]